MNKEKTKNRITFYVDDDIYEWYQGLPRHKGSDVLNQMIRAHKVKPQFKNLSTTISTRRALSDIFKRLERLESEKQR